MGKHFSIFGWAGLFLSFIAGVVPAQESTTGFEETFALAKNRAETLKQLIPGTEDFYFYTCLERLEAKDWDTVKKTLDTWVEGYGPGERTTIIENRLFLLAYEDDPQATIRFLKDRLKPKLDDQPALGGGGLAIPTVLDSKLLTLDAWVKRAFAKDFHGLSGFTDGALRFVDPKSLTPIQLGNFLDRIRTPDIEDLPALVVQDLRNRGETFGSRRIHRGLTRGQMDTLAKLMPGLLRQKPFVSHYAALLRGAIGEPVKSRDGQGRLRYLANLEDFCQKLDESQNSFRAHVLYFRLREDGLRGIYNRKRFLEFIALPRWSDYVNEDYYDRFESKKQEVDLDLRFNTGFGKPQDDESLVREHLEHFFETEDSIAPFSPFMDEQFLNQVLAETKILRGSGDGDRWFSLLDDSERYEELKEKVEIKFVHGNKQVLKPADDVKILVDIKNVNTLLVKVYRINTANYYRETKKELSASIDLDGLVASEELTFAYDEPSIRRVRREFTFPQLSGPGVFVIDFLGNGLSSRAIIKKGRLRYIERFSSAGHVFRIMDDDGSLIKKASIAFGQKRYEADEDGDIFIPYSTRLGRKPIVLMAGERATLEKFWHRRESYRMAASVFIRRESLIGGAVAKVVVRPTLIIHENDVSLGLLKNVKLRLHSTDLNGISSTSEVAEIKFDDGKDFVHEFRVPQKLQKIRIQLEATVRLSSTGQDMEMKTPWKEFLVNTIDREKETKSLFLSKTEEGYVLDVLGKNGEAIANYITRLKLTHRDFDEEFSVLLKTNDQGRIVLGELTGISEVTTERLKANRRSWKIREQGVVLPRNLHGVLGTVIQVPYLGDAPAVDPQYFSLFSTGLGLQIEDYLSHLFLVDGLLELRGLKEGEYVLQIKDLDKRITIRVGDGNLHSGWLHNSQRSLEVKEENPLTVLSPQVEGDFLVIPCKNIHGDTRVHVFASHYLPSHDPFENLRSTYDPTLAVRKNTVAESTYASGRAIADELRYILERRFAKKFPGNMLERPQILLNPLAVNVSNETRDSEIGEESSGSGGGFAPSGGSMPGPGPSGVRYTDPGLYANLDFLGSRGSLIANLKPGNDGLVRVKLSGLGEGQMLQVVAEQGNETVYRSMVRPALAANRIDRRLQSQLNASKHYAEQRRVQFLRVGEKVLCHDVNNSEAMVFDSLSDVFALFRTLSGNRHLSQFAPLMRWPELSKDEKLKFYSEHACHELHFFLSKKDEPFFSEIVLPYLRNKQKKTFLDHYLLGANLDSYLRPHDFSRLNLVEQILLLKQKDPKTKGDKKYVANLLATAPFNPPRLDHLFATSLAAQALESDYGRSGFFSGVMPKLQGSRSKGQVPANRHLEDDSDLEEEDADGFVEDSMEEGSLDKDSIRKHKEQKDARQRELNRRLYRKPDATRRSIEHNYWQRLSSGSKRRMIRVSEFWNEYASHSPSKPFASKNFYQAANSFAEMMFALSLLEIPFDGKNHVVTSQNGGATLVAQSPLLLITKEIKESKLAKTKIPLIVSQTMVRADDPSVVIDRRRHDKIVSDEFLVDVVYNCRVVVANPTSSPLDLRLLLQIPTGSMLVGGGDETSSISLRVSGYGTVSRSYEFYFPSPGVFEHYPVHIAIGDETVAAAKPTSMRVLLHPSKKDITSWRHVSQEGSEEEVLTYLASTNLREIEVERIAWRLGNKNFFDQVIGILRANHHFSERIWAYALVHQDEKAMGEYLSKKANFVAACGYALDSPLLTIDPFKRGSYQHVEFSPLFHGRAHQFGKQREISNVTLAKQFAKFMRVLSYKKNLSSDDWMQVTYYLLLQDRVEEGLAAAKKIDPTQIVSSLQLDYLTAYLDFFTEGHQLARRIAERHKDHPVLRWRRRFRQVIAQLDEVEGRGMLKEEGEQDIARKEKEFGRSLSVKIEGEKIIVDYAQLTNCHLAFYQMDVEFLFSSNPFVREDMQSFAYVRPHAQVALRLEGDSGRKIESLPQEYRNSNLLVEVRGQGLVHRATSYANSLAVRLDENYGRLQVLQAQSKNPLPRVYVKVFSKDRRGRIRFHKDGYTDLRGKFDYASLSKPSGGGAKKFSILILSEKDGAMIREVWAPNQ